MSSPLSPFELNWNQKSYFFAHDNITEIFSKFNSKKVGSVKNEKHLEVHFDDKCPTENRCSAEWLSRKNNFLTAFAQGN